MTSVGGWQTKPRADWKRLAMGLRKSTKKSSNQSKILSKTMDSRRSNNVSYGGLEARLGSGHGALLEVALRVQAESSPKHSSGRTPTVSALPGAQLGLSLEAG